MNAYQLVIAQDVAIATAKAWEQRAEALREFMPVITTAKK